VEAWEDNTGRGGGGRGAGARPPPRLLATACVRVPVSPREAASAMLWAVPAGVGVVGETAGAPACTRAAGGGGEGGGSGCCEGRATGERR
jgi:hypothetical protein